METKGLIEDYRYTAIITVDCDFANKGTTQIIIADESGAELFVAKNCDRRVAASILRMGIEGIVENRGLPGEIAVDFVDYIELPWLAGSQSWLAKWCCVHRVGVQVGPSPWSTKRLKDDGIFGRKACAGSAPIGMPLLNS